MGILLGVASFVLNQNAYAQTDFGYPGNPATPTIGTGPSLGCTPAGMSNASWVGGFNPLTRVKFLVDGRAAGTTSSESNSGVLVTITFLRGDVVQINGNASVPVRHGQNFVTIIGHKSESGSLVRVGLRLPFATPLGDNNLCVTSPSGPPSTGTSFPTRPTSSTFPIETTAHGLYPTTLAKAIETPLVISPNRVILAASLLAAVLAAVLSAGALGVMWSAGGSARAAPSGSASGDAQPSPESSPDTGGQSPGGPEPGGPAAPSAPGGPVEPSGTSSTPPGASAFTRGSVNPAGGGGDGA